MKSDTRLKLAAHGRSKAAWSHSALAATWPLIAMITLTACVGIPMSRETVDYPLATTWTQDGRLVTLAQRVRLGKTAWIASPEGPGVQELYDYGDLVLLDEKQAVTHRTSLPESGAQALQAFGLDHGEGFVVISMARGKQNCYLITNDGALSPCSAPDGYTFSPFSSYVLPISAELLTRQFDRSGRRDEALNVRTGLVRTVDDEFRGLWLTSYYTLEADQQRLKPCAMKSARLSPREDRWVVGCTESDGARIKTSVWVVGRDSPPGLIYEFPVLMHADLVRQSYIEYRNRKQRDNLRRPHEEDGIAWSADQTAVYWCSPPQRQGVIAYLDGRPPITGIPCLTRVSWSPDGTRVAGVNGMKVVTWNIDNDAF